MKHLIFAFAFFMGASMQAQSQVVLNEIFGDPGSGKHEFFEVYNSSTSKTPLSLDGYTLITYFQVDKTKGFYVLDLPNINIQPRSFAVGSAANPFNFQGTTGSSLTDFSWNDPNLEINYGSLQKWVLSSVNQDDGNKDYDLSPVPSTFNDLFNKLSGNGSSYISFIFRNGVLMNGFFGGTGGSTSLPSYLTSMPTLKLTSVMSDKTINFNFDLKQIKNNEVEYVNQEAGSDNGFIRAKDGLCGTWTKSASAVNHTPKQANGSATGSVGMLSISSNINRASDPLTTSTIEYFVAEGPTNLFPVELQLYVDDGSIDKELDANDVFLTSQIQKAITSIPYSTPFSPKNENIMLAAKTAAGCFDQIIYITDVQPIILPVSMTTFSGQILNNHAFLQWQVTENETGNRFEVEKSKDGITFKMAAVVFNSTKIGRENYSYKEGTEFREDAFYRIKILNNNQTVSYSKTIYLNHKVGLDSKIELLKNPISDEVNIRYKASETNEGEVFIYNAGGSTVRRIKVSLLKGSNIISIPLGTSIRSGAYIFEIVMPQSKNTMKFIKQ